MERDIRDCFYRFWRGLSGILWAAWSLVLPSQKRTDAVEKKVSTAISAKGDEDTTQLTVSGDRK